MKKSNEEKFECIFCYDSVKDRIIEETHMFYAVKDGYPVTEGHLLVIPKRHVAEYFNLSDAERREALLIDQYYFHGIFLTLSANDLLYV